MTVSQTQHTSTTSNQNNIKRDQTKPNPTQSQNKAKALMSKRRLDDLNLNKCLKYFKQNFELLVDFSIISLEQFDDVLN